MANYKPGQGCFLPAAVGYESVIPNPTLKLLDQVREVMRLKHYSIRTERTYCEWIRRYVHFHHMTSREEMVPAEPKMEEFLSDLAVKGEVAVSRQNQAFNALLFVYREVLHVQIGQIDSVRATRPARVPTVLTAQEARQERFLNALWDQVAEIHDLHFGPPQGTFFTKANPLTLPSRFGELKPKRKKP